MSKAREFIKIILRKYQTGFTLVEILIVIGILGVLSTVGFTSYTATQKNSRDSRRKIDLEMIKQALEVYKSDKGNYPPGSVGDVFCDSSLGAYVGAACNGSFVPCTSNCGNDWSYTELIGYESDLWEGLVPTYIQKLPVDPTNSKTSYYYYEPNCGGAATVCGISVTCPASTCCAYELGAYLESTSTWYKICNP